MATRSSFGTARYSSGDSDILVVPKRWNGDPTRRGVIFHHGANANCSQGVHSDLPKLTAALLAIAEAGYPVLSIDGGSSSSATNKWANDTAMARFDEAWTYMKGTVGAKTDKVHLIGWSMGALTALRWASRNKANVASLIGFTPVSDLTDFRDNNRGGYQSSVDAAYTNGYTEATYGATSNPKTFAAAGALSGLPTRLYYANNDALVIPSTVTGLAASIGGTAQAIDVGALGHTDAAVGGAPISNLLAFLAAQP